MLLYSERCPHPLPLTDHSIVSGPPTITTITNPRPLHGDPNVGANDAASLWEAFVHLSFTVSPDCLYLCELQEPQWSRSSCTQPCFPQGKVTNTMQ